MEESGPIVVILSGCNIDMALHKRLIDGEDVDPAEKG